MNWFRLITAALATGCLWAPGCISHDVKRTEREQVSRKQVETLETLSSQELQVAAFAETLSDVHRAVVKIRPGAAVILLTPAPGRALGRETVDRINDFTLTHTGLSRSQIIMKSRGTRLGSQ